ncbi:transposase IS200 like protein [mine drainage metagenome]|uniref:Transposase IS200 like protein n=1 Tax=mine drainage metagenome TaxID=410659 RepID=A0A1J5TYU1_9ZZZZ
MRRPRLKVDALQEEGYYHCMSRTAGGEWLLGEKEKEVLRTQVWKLAEYCGLELVTYALMSNHYHVLVRVPQRHEVTDRELLVRYRALYPRLKPAQEVALRAVEADMARDGELARTWREKQLRQMFDVSQFNKLLKMRFSIWYNKTHKRYGTLWSERFKSVLVESGDALTKMAAYIDGNAVRAAIVKDPKDYRFCGYAEAVAGNPKARLGLRQATGGSWSEVLDGYRCLVIAMLSEASEDKARATPELFEEVLRTGGRLSLAEVLKCRIRYFTDGVILGSKEYVERMSARIDGKTIRQPQALAPVTDWAGLHVLSRMRSNLWG